MESAVSATRATYDEIATAYHAWRRPGHLLEEVVAFRDCLPPGGTVADVGVPAALAEFGRVVRPGGA